MAKAKKTEAAAESNEEKKPAAKKAPAEKKSAAAGSAEKKPAAAKAAGKKATEKKAAAAPAAQPAGVPLIDTNLAAQSAAKMLLNRAVAGDAPTPAAAQAGKESSTFKNLKDQLAKPKPAGLSHLFGPSTDTKKSAGTFLGPQRGGHNQTQGGFNKTGVPRRTNG